MVQPILRMGALRGVRKPDEVDNENRIVKHLLIDSRGFVSKLTHVLLTLKRYKWPR